MSRLLADDRVEPLDDCDSSLDLGADCERENLLTKDETDLLGCYGRALSPNSIWVYEELDRHAAIGREHLLEAIDLRTKYLYFMLSPASVLSRLSPRGAKQCLREIASYEDRYGVDRSEDLSIGARTYVHSSCSSRGVAPPISEDELLESLRVASEIQDEFGIGLGEEALLVMDRRQVEERLWS